jgi:predicted dehydrogenase
VARSKTGFRNLVSGSGKSNIVEDKVIKVGVVGIGHLGNYHLQKYRMMPECTIIGVADTIEERAVKASADHHCEFFTDHHHLLGKLDAVSIAVPTQFHYAVARDFLADGTDVLLEKPLTATLEEADELIRLAERKNAVFQIGFVERFNPAIVALGKVIGKPLFIETHRLHPFFTRGTDVDVVLDLMIHDLDIILHFVNAAVESVDAVGVSVLSDNVDIANARVAFQNGCVANITASRVTGKHMQKIRFFGFEGYHSIDYGRRELVSLSTKHGNEGKMEIGLNDVEIKQQDPLEEEIRSFIHCVKTRTTPLVSGREARASLALALQIIEKMKSGRKKISTLSTTSLSP